MDAQTIIAKRIARELHSGMLVNLGIGIPTLVANYVPKDVNVFFQSENGLIGTGPIPEEGMTDPTFTDAAGHPVSALPGASTFDSAISFGLIRGGHLDMAILGGLQVDGQGHLANWMISRQDGPWHGWCDGSCFGCQTRGRGHAAHSIIKQARFRQALRHHHSVPRWRGLECPADRGRGGEKLSVPQRND